ncbi:restriction endonuclease subunit S [Mycoplasmopsis cynos]|nr:restriction endonuclease subunit S [Mycoplasmopsis cynos]
MSKNNMVPSIRFKEFTNAWEQERLGNLLIPKREKNINGYELESFSISNKYGFISQNEFFRNGGIAISADKRNSILVKNNYFAYNPARINIGSIGLYKSSKIGLVSPLYEVFVSNDLINNDWLFIWFKSKHFNKIVERKKAGSVRQTINLNDISDDQIIIPSFYEQCNIATTFQSLNSLITLHQRKLNALENLKKTLLEKMFPSENSIFPSIRFKEFTNAWEQEKLINIGKTYSGLTGKTKKDFGYGDAKYVTYLNVFNNPISNIVQLDFIKKDTKQNSVKYGDIFVTISSETPEEIGMTSIWQFNEKNVYLNSFCFGFRLDQIDNYNLYFLANNLRHKRLRRNIVLLAQGISRFNISKQKFMNLNIYLPSIIEQSRIGDICQSLNSLITLHQRKLNALENLKKTLLEKMFV